MGKKRLFTGLQPSGTLHIGNYLGALKQTVELLKDADGLVMIADYHALTTLKDTEGLRKNIPDVVRDYVAVGVDPKKAIIFQQSAVSQHTELGRIFCSMTPISSPWAQTSGNTWNTRARRPRNSMRHTERPSRSRRRKFSTPSPLCPVPTVRK